MYGRWLKGVAVSISFAACALLAAADERQHPPTAQKDGSPSDEVALPACQLPPRGIFIAHGGGSFTGPEIDILLREGGDELIYIPSDANPLTDENRKAIVARWQGRGFCSVTFLHADSHEQAMDPNFSLPLLTARAVFISGGKQDALRRYTGSPVVSRLRGVLERNGVILGTSAGMAMIGTRAVITTEEQPDGSLHIIEDDGWNFCPLVSDQHFLQKNRGWRLDRMCEIYPTLPGLGVDEKTACVIRFKDRGPELSVVGDSEVHLYSRRSEKPEVIRMKSGDEGITLAFED
ncbi:MAG: Type 1 glutamine amidotransferase-like domain-containing protein [Bdellovibrionota bacterium]